MLIAQQKLKENIAEYFLYMYQIEDLIRAYNFEVDPILENIVRPQIEDEDLIREYRKWYTGLISDMRLSNAMKKGHMSSLRELMVELSYLHNTLLTMANDQKYKAIVEDSSKYIEEFRQKSLQASAHPLEVALQAMYMKLLLKLQKKDISSESEEAFEAMRKMLAYLSLSYQKMKSGELDFLQN